MTKKPETVKEEDLIKRKDGLCYVKDAQVPFTGISEEFSEKGLPESFYDNALHSRQNYKNGQREGLKERLDDNGQVWFRENYNKGKQEGLCEEFDKDGNLTKTETWDNGQLVE